MTRRNLTPAPPAAAGDVHGTRRSSGARLEASERVRIVGEGFETIGWTLNVSRGGVRLIVEEPLGIGGEYRLQVGDDSAPFRAARVVWVQDEADGQIVGAQFLDGSGSEIPPPNT
ncbi:MAG: PilZ domain-containing protein [Polyangiaceae bacterium]|nr:PilZ domain-containing protein [Polyangiaceae bacterium]